MQHNLSKTFVAGLVAGVVLNLALLLTFRLLGFGWNGGGVLLDPALQSPKVVAVWTQIEPLPLVVSRPAPILLGLILFGIGHAFIYRWLAPAWPQGIKPRAWRMALLVFFLSYLFWEFFTPFNQFREPLLLVGLELTFWVAIALAEAFALASVFEWGAAGGS